MSTSESKSTGPKSDLGKLRASKNAIKHGIYSQTTVLFNEEQEEYDEHLQDFVTCFQPQDRVETATSTSRSTTPPISSKSDSKQSTSPSESPSRSNSSTTASPLPTTASNARNPASTANTTLLQAAPGYPEKRPNKKYVAERTHFRRHCHDHRSNQHDRLIAICGQVIRAPKPLHASSIQITMRSKP